MSSTAISYYRYGEPLEVLKQVRRLSPIPGKGEVAVRVTARPVNPSDLIPVRGAYAHRIALPAIAGYEGVGIVEAAGEGVSEHWIGMRVLPLRGEGTWQDTVLSPACWAVPVPSFIPDGQACQLYINPVTSWVLCTARLGLGAGDCLLLNAASSAFGKITAQLASVLGIRLIAIVRQHSRVEELYRLGAWKVISEEAGSHCLQDIVLEWTEGRGADAAVDCIGGTSATSLFSCIRSGGRAASIGLLSGKPFTDYRLVQNRRIQYFVFHLRHWLSAVSSEEWHAVFRQLIELVQSGRLVLPSVSRYYDLDNFRTALTDAERPGHSGKIVLVSRLI